MIDPFRPDFSAFLFKIQANRNKAHRDRIASVSYTHLDVYKRQVLLNPGPARPVKPEVLAKVDYLTPNEHLSLIHI